MPKGLTSKERRSKAMKEVWRDPILRQKILASQTSWNKGKHLTEQHKQKIREAQQGEKAFWYGKSPSLETRNKIADAMKGNKTHLWKGGISKKYHRGIKYRKWRRTVFIRDEFTCKKCDKKHIYITAHHIKSWNDYPELRYDVKNGKTLCEECHEKTDNYKGKNKNKGRCCK